MFTRNLANFTSLCNLAAMLFLLAGCGRTEPTARRGVCIEPPCQPLGHAYKVPLNGSFEVLTEAGAAAPPLGWRMKSGDWNIQATLSVPGISGDNALWLKQEWPIAAEVASDKFAVVEHQCFDLLADIKWPSTDPVGLYLYMGIEWYMQGSPIGYDYLGITPVLGTQSHLLTGCRPAAADQGSVQFRRYDRGYSQPIIDAVSLTLLQ